MIDQLLSEIIDVTQFGVWVVIVILLVSEIQWAYYNKSRWAYIIPTVFLATHGLIFYSYVLAVALGWVSHPLVRIFFSNWSVALRLHEYITLVVMSRFRLSLTRDRIEHERKIGEI